MYINLGEEFIFLEWKHQKCLPPTNSCDFGKARQEMWVSSPDLFYQFQLLVSKISIKLFNAVTYLKICPLILQCIIDFCLPKPIKQMNVTATGFEPTTM